MHELEIIRRRPRRARRAPPLLFIHGAYSGAWCWDEFFLPYLAARGYDCCAVSLRGHGGSAGGDALDHASLDDYVADVRAAARTLDAAPIVVGHSMGAVVAQRYVAAHGAVGVALLASVPPHGLMGTAMELCWRDPELLAQFALVQSGHAYLANFHRLRRALFAADMPLDRAIGYFARMRRESQRALLDLSYLQGRAIQLDRKVPLAVIGGEQDGLFRPEAVHLTASWHDAQAAILPGLGHSMMLDCGWRSAADHILEWLQQEPRPNVRASREGRPRAAIPARSAPAARR